MATAVPRHLAVKNYSLKERGWDEMSYTKSCCTCWWACNQLSNAFFFLFISIIPLHSFKQHVNRSKIPSTNQNSIWPISKYKHTYCRNIHVLNHDLSSHRSEYKHQTRNDYVVRFCFTHVLSLLNCWTSQRTIFPGLDTISSPWFLYQLPSYLHRFTPNPNLKKSRSRKIASYQR